MPTLSIKCPNCGKDFSLEDIIREMERRGIDPKVALKQAQQLLPLLELKRGLGI